MNDQAAALAYVLVGVFTLSIRWHTGNAFKRYDDQETFLLIMLHVLAWPGVLAWCLGKWIASR